MRLLFFYLAHRNAGYYLDFLPTEGYFCLLKRMVETGIVDEISVIIDSGQKLPPVEYMDGLTGCVVPGIENTPVGKDDIVWVRGGWKSWFPFWTGCMKNAAGSCSMGPIPAGSDGPSGM